MELPRRRHLVHDEMRNQTFILVTTLVAAVAGLSLSARGVLSDAASAESLAVSTHASSTSTRSIPLASTTTSGAESSVSPPCTNSQVVVSDAGGGAGLGHEDQMLFFINDSQTACSLSGYPGVAGLNAAGQQIVQARRTTGGYLGGLLPGVLTLQWWNLDQANAHQLWWREPTFPRAPSSPAPATPHCSLHLRI